MSSNEGHPWGPDWHARLRRDVRRKGFDSVAEYLGACPGKDYVKAAEDLGGYAALQLLSVQMDEAGQSGTIRDAASDALVRFFRSRLRRGWAKGFHAVYNTVCVHADWVVALTEGEGYAELRPLLDRVWRSLEELSPPVGWVPASPEDPYIRQAFDEGWPLDVPARQ